MVKPVKETPSRSRENQEIFEYRTWLGYAEMTATMFGGSVSGILSNDATVGVGAILPKDIVKGYSVNWENVDPDTQEVRRSALRIFPGQVFRAVQYVSSEGEDVTISGVTKIDPDVSTDTICVFSRPYVNTTVESIIGKEGIKKYRVTYNPQGKLVSQWEYTPKNKTIIHKDIRGRETIVLDVLEFSSTEREGQVIVIADTGGRVAGIKLGQFGIEKIFQVPQGEEAIEIYSSAFVDIAEDMLRMGKPNVS